MSKLRPVAAFDIDGTLFRSSLLIELVETLIAEEVLPQQTRARYQQPLINWMNRHGSYEDYIMAVVDAWYEHIKGVPLKTIEAVADRVVATHKHRVYRYSRDLTKDLSARGYFLLAISRSPKTIAEKFARNFGFDKVYGDLLEIDKRGVLTGRVLSEDIADKAKILKRAITKEKLTLTGSVAVGDTEGDIPMLELAAQPICFNPNGQLFSHARAKGWQVVVERKDVIYTL